MIIMRYEIDAIYDYVFAGVGQCVGILLFGKSWVLEGSLADEWGWLLEEKTKSN